MTERPAEPPPLLLPRGLIFFAAIWLIVSFGWAIGFRTPVQPSSASYTPGVRMMLMSITAGLMLGWPLLRLSQARAPFPVRQTLLDLVVLVALVQVVLWPMRLVTTWSPLRTAAIDGSLAVWVVLVGAIIAISIGSTRALVRNGAMAGCVAMCLAGPGVAWIMGLLGATASTGLIRFSPFMAVRTLGSGGSSDPAVEIWMWIGGLGAVSLAVWMGVFMIAGLQRRSGV